MSSTDPSEAEAPETSGDLLLVDDDDLHALRTARALEARAKAGKVLLLP